MKIQTIAFLVLLMVTASNAQGFFDDFKNMVPEDSFDDSNGLVPGGKEADFAKKALKHAENVLGELKTETTNTEVKDGKPNFCGKRDCPSFIVMNKTKHYELRCYRGAPWVSTKGFGSPQPIGGEVLNMFKRLQKYISGANKIKVRMNMTVPILVEAKGKGIEKEMKMSFFIPEEYQLKPPKPVDDNVFLEGKEFCAYVSSFGGYMIHIKKFLLEFLKLEYELAKDGLKDAYLKEPVYYAGYNMPLELLNRHNEVMLIKV